MYRKVLILAFLLVFPVDSRKIGGGGGGGSSRGGSASRGSSAGRGSGGYQQGQPASGYQPAGGNYPQQPAYRPQQPAYPNQPHPGGYPNQQAGYHPPQQGYHPANTGYQGGYHPQQPTFNTGSGPGSASRGSQWKTALAAGAVGAVGGIVTYELGKAILKSATEPAHINGRPYYFNNENNQSPQKSGEQTCSMPLEQLIKQTQPTTAAPTTAAPDANGTEVSATSTPGPDQLLSSLQFKDGTRPKTVTWHCKVGSEICCGTECCPAPQISAPPQGAGAGGPNAASAKGTSVMTIVLLILLGILLLTCCCCFIFYEFFRSLFGTCCPSSNQNETPHNDDSKYDNSQPQGFASYQTQPLQQQDASIPLQSYPGMQQQGGYSSGPTGYPSGPTGYPSGPGYVYPSQPTTYQQYPPQPQYPQNY